MKSRILGLALVFVLGLSMLLPAAQVSGRTLEWASELIMEEGSNTSPKIVHTGSEVLDLAGSTGTTAWAVMTFADGFNKGIRSTNSGRTWSYKTRQSDGTTNIDNTLNRVTLASDDPAVVVASSPTKVWLTTSSGDDGTWTKIGDTADNLLATFTATGVINTVSVSAPDADGYRWVAVGGRTAAVAAAGTAMIAVAKMSALGGFVNYTTVPAAWTVARDVLAVAFSPRFRYDKGLVAVRLNNAGTGTDIQLGETTTPAWDAAFGATAISTTVAANRARIALPDTFYRLDDVERVVYVSLDSGAAGGVYRMNNTTPKELFTGRYSSVAYNNALNQLLFGSMTSGRVELSTNANSSSPSSVYAPTLNRAAGANVSGVAWAGATPLAATGGAEGGIHKGAADGLSWVGYGVLDTDLADITDVAISDDGKTIYIASIFGNNVSIWKSTAGAKLDIWERVLAELETDATAPDPPIVRIAPGKPESVFVAFTGSKQIRYSADGGKTWKRSESDWNIDDMAVKSDQIVFALNKGSSNGYVSVSRDGGFSFAKATLSQVTPDMIVVEPKTGHVIVVGASSGFGRLSVSKDDGATWTRTTEAIGIADDAAPFLVAPAPDYDKTSIVYVAQTRNISRWKVGGTAADGWEDWYEINTAANSTGYPIAGAEVITGIGFNGNALYAIWNEPGVASGFARTADFAERKPTWADVPTGAAVVVDFNAAPGSLRFSTEGGNSRVWAVNRNSAALDSLWSYGDVLGATVAPAVTGPENGFKAGVTTALGVVQINPVRFNWTEVHQLATYTLRIGTDKDVTQNFADYNPTPTTDLEFVTVSAGTGAGTYPFVIGETYYWKVRVTTPAVGPWSKISNFSIPKPETVTPLKLNTPENGAKDISRNPAFSWEPIVGAKEYKVVVAGNSLLANPTAESLVTVPAFRIVTDLEYNKAYFWQVTPTKPTAGEPSAVYNFTTEKAPVPPPKPPAPPKKEYVCPYDGATFDNPQALAAHCSKWAPQPPPPPAPPVTPSWVWIVVGIGAALVIATLVLIVTTRRPPAP